MGWHGCCALRAEAGVGVASRPGKQSAKEGRGGEGAAVASGETISSACCAAAELGLASNQFRGGISPSWQLPGGLEILYLYNVSGHAMPRTMRLCFCSTCAPCESP